MALDKSGIYYRLLSNSALVKIGNISAYTFLIHAVVIEYFTSINHLLLNEQIAQIYVAIAAFAGTLFFAYLWDLKRRTNR